MITQFILEGVDARVYKVGRYTNMSDEKFCRVADRMAGLDHHRFINHRRTNIFSIYIWLQFRNEAGREEKR
jgi:hypothetical protein